MRELLPRIEQLPLWPLISAPVFLLLFLGLACWIFSRSRRRLYQAIELLPLEDDLSPDASMRENH